MSLFIKNKNLRSKNSWAFWSSCRTFKTKLAVTLVRTNIGGGRLKIFLSTLRFKIQNGLGWSMYDTHAQQSIIWWLEQAVKITRVIPLAIKSTTLIGINCWFENNSMVFIFHFITFFEYEISKLLTNILVALILF